MKTHFSISFHAGQVHFAKSAISFQSQILWADKQRWKYFWCGKYWFTYTLKNTSNATGVHATKIFHSNYFLRLHDTVHGCH